MTDSKVEEIIKFLADLQVGEEEIKAIRNRIQQLESEIREYRQKISEKQAEVRRLKMVLTLVSPFRTTAAPRKGSLIEAAMRFIEQQRSRKEFIEWAVSEGYNQGAAYRAWRQAAHRMGLE